MRRKIPFAPMIALASAYSGLAAAPPRTEHVEAGRAPVVTAGEVGTVACCLQDVCVETAGVECINMGGYELTGTPTCAPDSCTLGACCLTLGTCDDNDGAGTDLATCTNAGGTYTGGALCGAIACPICDIEGPTHCQDDNGPYIVLIDRALWTPGNISRWVDDFQAADDGPLDRLCYHPAFFNPSQAMECSGTGQTPDDDFQMRLYEDAGGLPGTEIGTAQFLTLLGKESLGGTSPMWTYTFEVPAPPMLTGGECYWLEVTGAGEGPGGCSVYATLSADGNSYVVNDLDGSFGPEDVRTTLGDPPDPDVDIAFCVENGLGEGGCGEFIGACCTTAQGDCRNLTAQACASLGGLFNPTISCSPEACPMVPPCSDCPDADDLNLAGFSLSTGGNSFSFDFSTSFCNNAPVNTPCDVNQGDTGLDGTSPIGNARWYAYTMGADECGTLTISTCDDAGYDGTLAVWIDECPTGEAPVACGDDTCGVGGGMPVVSLNAYEGQTVLVKIGGWNGDAGDGTMLWTLDPGICAPQLPPLHDDRLNINDEVVDCEDDGDCLNAAVCRNGTCYAPVQRFLGIRPNPARIGTWTYRLSLDTGVAGSIPLGFAGAPQTKLALGPGPGQYVYVDIVDEANADYRDWGAHADAEGGGYLLLYGCEVAPLRNYIIQAIAAGADTSNEADYSMPLTLPTAKFGDATGGGAVNTAADGASSVLDAFACVLAFQNNQGGPKHWYDVEPTLIPNGAWSVADIYMFVLGFQTKPYLGPEPQDCP